MQKDISTKLKENSTLEKEIDRYNSETKTLQEQFKQNKEISERCVQNFYPTVNCDKIVCMKVL